VPSRRCVLCTPSRSLARRWFATPTSSFRPTYARVHAVARVAASDVVRPGAAVRLQVEFAAVCARVHARCGRVLEATAAAIAAVRSASHALGYFYDPTLVTLARASPRLDAAYRRVSDIGVRDAARARPAKLPLSPT
jgi:hypothetical protein